MQDTETEVDQTHPDSPMSPLAAYQSACQPQSPPPVRPRAKDGDSLKVCIRYVLCAMMVSLTCVVCLQLYVHESFNIANTLYHISKFRISCIGSICRHHSMGGSPISENYSALKM